MGGVKELPEVGDQKQDGGVSQGRAQINRAVGCELVGGTIEGDSSVWAEGWFPKIVLSGLVQ